ncbi:MAG: hypothetical protein KDA86_17090 [Planctomycetaceae bacterium]|nr:hypothetical protein [Planctomycetaceae bacterium]
MILVGIDDTDTSDSRGTNQLAKHLARVLSPAYRCLKIVRHQLLFDDRVPYTSKNGSASIWLEPMMSPDLDRLIETIRTEMLCEFIPGSDPGLCVTAKVPSSVTEFGHRCQREVVNATDARELASQEKVVLEGLGGTCDGVIGALAAVGLAATGDDGRVVQWQGMHDELSGVHPVAEVMRRDVIVRSHADHQEITEGMIDVGKKLRPNLRGGKQVVFVTRDPDATELRWLAQKLT